jgi:hypothetical protein
MNKKELTKTDRRYLFFICNTLLPSTHIVQKFFFVYCSFMTFDIKCLMPTHKILWARAKTLFMSC